MYEAPGDRGLLAGAEEGEHRGDRLGVLRVFAHRLVPGDRGGDRPEGLLAELVDLPPLLVRVLAAGVEEPSAEEDLFPANRRRVARNARSGRVAIAFHEAPRFQGECSTGLGARITRAAASPERPEARGRSGIAIARLGIAVPRRGTRLLRARSESTPRVFAVTRASRGERSLGYRDRSLGYRDASPGCAVTRARSESTPRVFSLTRIG